MPWAAVLGVAALAAVSSYQKSQQAAKSSDAQAALYEESGRRRRELAKVQEERSRRESSKLMGLQRAKLAAAGVEPSTGTALLTQEETARESELQALLTRAQGIYEAQTQEHQGALGRWQSRTIRKSAFTNALLAGASTGVSAYGAMGGVPGGGGGGQSAASIRYGSTVGAGGIPTIGYDYYGS